MTTTEIIILIAVYAVCFAGYVWGTVAETRARRAVSEMEAKDNAEVRYAAMMSEMQSWIKGVGK